MIYMKLHVSLFSLNLMILHDWMYRYFLSISIARKLHCTAMWLYIDVTWWWVSGLVGRRSAGTWGDSQQQSYWQALTLGTYPPPTTDTEIRIAGWSTTKTCRIAIIYFNHFLHFWFLLMPLCTTSSVNSMHDCWFNFLQCLLVLKKRLLILFSTGLFCISVRF